MSGKVSPTGRHGSGAADVSVGVERVEGGWSLDGYESPGGKRTATADLFATPTKSVAGTSAKGTPSRAGSVLGHADPNVLHLTVDNIDDREPGYDLTRPGPMSGDRRSCTDVFWLLLLLAYMGGAAFVAVYAVTHGDALRLVYGADSFGNVCGRARNSPIPNATLSGRDMSERSNVFFYAFTLACHGPAAKLNPLCGDSVEVGCTLTC